MPKLPALSLFPPGLAGLRVIRLHIYLLVTIPARARHAPPGRPADQADDAEHHQGQATEHGHAEYDHCQYPGVDGECLVHSSSPAFALLPPRCPCVDRRTCVVLAQ